MTTQEYQVTSTILWIMDRCENYIGTCTVNSEPLYNNSEVMQPWIFWSSAKFNLKSLSIFFMFIFDLFYIIEWSWCKAWYFFLFSLFLENSRIRNIHPVFANIDDTDTKEHPDLELQFVDHAKCPMWNLNPQNLAQWIAAIQSLNITVYSPMNLVFFCIVIPNG